LRGDQSSDQRRLSTKRVSATIVAFRQDRVEEVAFSRTAVR